MKKMRINNSTIKRKPALQELSNEVQHIYLHLCLNLPATTEAINYQVGQIAVAQDQLEALEQRAYTLFRREHNPSTRKSYWALTQLTQQLMHQADGLTLLAEEFLIDPEGAIACLKAVNCRTSSLLQQLMDTTGRRVKAEG